MIATPLARREGASRQRWANLVVGGLAATTTAAAARRWGPSRAASAAGVVIGCALAVERAGTATGVPFGRYRYSGRLRPTVLGVPAAVPLAWWAMGLPAREAAHAALGGRTTPGLRAATGAAAMTAWDLFLDPQMTAERFWQWERPGHYRGIPLSNYAGWLVISAGLMLALERLLPPTRVDRLLIAEYAAMGAMETLGFAVFFRDRTVALVGAIGMLPLAVISLVRRG
jgi:uncharacterized membrane protein